MGQSPAQLAQNVFMFRINLNLATFDLICVIIVTPGPILDIWGNVQHKPHHVCLNGKLGNTIVHGLIWFIYHINMRMGFSHWRIDHKMIKCRLSSYISWPDQFPAWVDKRWNNSNWFWSLWALINNNITFWPAFSSYLPCSGQPDTKCPLLRSPLSHGAIWKLRDAPPTIRTVRSGLEEVGPGTGGRLELTWVNNNHNLYSCTIVYF